MSITMPNLPPNWCNDSNVYLVNTKKDGVVLCTTFLALNDDGVSISINNDVVFKSIDPLSESSHYLDQETYYSSDEILSWELIRRVMSGETENGLTSYGSVISVSPTSIQVSFGKQDSINDFFAQLASAETKDKKVRTTLFIQDSELNYRSVSEATGKVECTHSETEDTLPVHQIRLYGWNDMQTFINQVCKVGNVGKGVKVTLTFP